MKAEIFRKWFEHAIFPVITVTAEGVVSNKNRSAKKYLPMLRRGADAIRRLRGKMPLAAGTDVEIIGDSPYRHAVVFSDEGGFALLFLSRLQYPDAENVAKRIFRACGTELSGLFAGAPHGETEPPLPFGRERIYTDLIGIGTEAGLSADACVYDIQKIMQALSSRLRGAFRCLGYRISLYDTFPAWDKKYVKLSLYDFIFTFSRFLYILMRCSENGTVGLMCDCDESSGCHILRFTARTAISAAAVKKGRDTVDFLAGLAPECALELMLFKNAGDLSRNTRLSVDKYGKFIVEYRIKYIEKPILQVKSLDFEDWELDFAIKSFFHEIRCALKSRTRKS